MLIKEGAARRAWRVSAVSLLLGSPVALISVTSSPAAAECGSVNRYTGSCSFDVTESAPTQTPTWDYNPDSTFDTEPTSSEPSEPVSFPVAVGNTGGNCGLFEECGATDQPTTGSTAPRVTPQQVAQAAIAKLTFKAIDIGIVPEPGADKLGLVGMPTWMWIKDPSSSTTGPLTASASAGGLTITATARLDRIEWDMGDGTVVTCAGDDAKGTEYKDSFGRQSSPTCGHRYASTSGDQPNNEYTVTASSFWVVTWQGAGQSGTITLDPLVREAQIRVGEMQVLEQ